MLNIGRKRRQNGEERGQGREEAGLLGDARPSEESVPADDHGAIQEDIKAEEALMREIMQLEEEAEGLQEARARRMARSDDETPSPEHKPT